MLKNKIYKYFFSEILKNFITILLTFTAIAWVVRSVNFLDLMVEDGFTSIVYFQYAALNVTNIITRFVPLSFLLSLTISILKFERQQEFLILWTAGLTKIRVINIFLLIGLIITLFQLILSLIINPFFLNKSRYLLTNAEELKVHSILKSNDFSDSFDGITFFIEEKNDSNKLSNIFIRDENGKLNTIADKPGEKNNSTIIAKEGFVLANKLILFDGAIQTLNQKKEIKNIKFEKTEMSLNNIATRTISQPKIQETSTALLFECFFSKNNQADIVNCSKDDYKSVVAQTLSRRIGAPLYIPLITIIISFLLLYKKEKKFNFLKKYFLFIISFLMLVLAEILLKYTGISLLVASSYFVLPVIITFLLYLCLLKKIYNEKVS